MFTRNMVGKMTIADTSAKVFKTTTGVLVNRFQNSNNSANTTTNGQLTYSDTNTGQGSVWGNYGIVLGTGTTPPTIDDYKMESYIPEGVLHYARATISTPSNTTGEWANSGAFSLTQTVANNTENPVTVTEIGVYNGTSTSSTYISMLLTHDVISPVTIQPNETKTFVIAWNLSDILNGGSTTVTTQE